MSYFSFEEAFEVLKSRNEGKKIIELPNLDRYKLWTYHGIDYETLSKLYKIGRKKYLIYDIYVDAIVKMFNISEIQ